MPLLVSSPIDPATAPAERGLLGILPKTNQQKTGLLGKIELNDCKKLGVLIPKKNKIKQNTPHFDIQGICIMTASSVPAGSHTVAAPYRTQLHNEARAPAPCLRETLGSPGVSV